MYETIVDAMEYFGLGDKAIHRESCPKCSAIQVAEEAGAQSLPDLKAMINEEDFVPMEGACVAQEVFLILSNLQVLIDVIVTLYTFVGFFLLLWPLHTNFSFYIE